MRPMILHPSDHRERYRCGIALCVDQGLRAPEPLRCISMVLDLDWSDPKEWFMSSPWVNNYLSGKTCEGGIDHVRDKKSASHSKQLTRGKWF